MKKLLYSVIQFIRRIIHRVILRLPDSSIFKVGSCTFVGSKKFYNKVSEALKFLKDTDGKVYQEITSFEGVFVECITFPIIGNHRFANYSFNEFTISLNDQSWNEHGIIGRLYFVYLNSFRSKEEAAHQVAAWMGKHGCPDRLVDFWNGVADSQVTPSEVKSA
jgi:hypothetical protein